MSAADGQSDSDRKEGDALVAFLLENRTLVNYASIIMIIFESLLIKEKSSFDLA